MAPDSYSLSPLQSSLSRKDCLAGSWTIQLVQTALILFLLLCFGCLTCPFIKAAGRHLSLSLFAGCLVKRQAWCQVHCFLMPLKLQVLTKGFLSPLYAGSASACAQKPASSQTISPPVRCQLNTMVLLIPFNSPLLRQNNNSKMPSFYCDPPPKSHTYISACEQTPKEPGAHPHQFCVSGWISMWTRLEHTVNTIKRAEIPLLSSVSTQLLPHLPNTCTYSTEWCSWNQALAKEPLYSAPFTTWWAPLM